MTAPVREVSVSYRLLGPLTVIRDDGAESRAVDLGTPKQRAVLALLLLNRGRVVSTDRLIDAVWGSEAPAGVLAGLQAYVSNLRRLLRDGPGAPPPILRRAPGYVIEVPAEQVDVAAFADAALAARAAIGSEAWSDAAAHAERALKGWGGELLEDLAGQPWLATETGGLVELRTECREALITAQLALGSVTPAVAGARALHDEHPLRDRAAWLHVMALHRAGRSSEALDALRVHVRRLDDELGLEPGAELRDLQVAVLRHDPALAAWPRSPGWTGATPLESPPEPVDPEEVAASREAATTPLVGRDRELEVIDAALADVRGGQVRWLLLTGEAGIGKTSLAEEAMTRVRAVGGREAWARCPEDEGTPAWWPVRQLVRALGADPDAVLLPSSGADVDAARFAVQERVAALLQDAARPGAPLGVVVDDVQWADPASAWWLAFLIGTLRRVPVLFVLTLRDGEDPTRVGPVLAALARTDGRRELAVGPLAPAAVAELAGQIAGTPLDEQEADALSARTGGNALFVAEYARLSPDQRRRGDLPRAVRAVVGRRLEALDAEVLEVLRAAAVIGDEVDVALLSATLGLGADELADALDAAADEHVIVTTPDAGGYAFAHGLIRDEILAGLPASRRQRLHGRVAAVLESDPQGDRVGRRARHLVAALPFANPAVVLEACRSAARAAEDRWTSDEAADWWGAGLQAFDLLPDAAGRAGDRDDLLVARIAALARAGRRQTVLSFLDGALLAAVQAGRTATVGRLAASLLRVSGGWPWSAAGGPHLAPLLARLDGIVGFVAADPVAHVRVLAASAVGHCVGPDTTPAERLSAEAIERAEALGDPDALADALLGRLVAYAGVVTHSRETIALAERLIAMRHREHRVDAVVARSVASMSHLQLADTAAVASVVREAIAESERLRLEIPRLQLRWTEGTYAAWRGDTTTAAERYALAGRVQAQSEMHYPGSYAIARLGLRREVEGLAGADLTDAPERDAWEAAVAAAEGDHGRAAAKARAWLDDLGPFVWSTLGHLALVAEAVADIGLDDEAPRVLDLLAPYAGGLATIGQSGVVGAVDLHAGRLHAVLGNTDRARELLQAALAMSEREGGAPTARRCRAALAAL